MSYAKHGITFSGLGEVMTVNLRTGDERVRALQTELARLGFLESDSSSAGIDGKWGPRTETALRNAARYVNYSATPFTRSSSRVTVPDELLGLIRAASPAPSGTEGRVAASTAPPPATDLRPSEGVRSPPGPPGPPAPEETLRWYDRTILGVRTPIFVAGSVGLLAAVGAVLYFSSGPSRPAKAMASNARRRRR